MGTITEILIVEDDFGFRDTLEDVLVEEGYSVSVARDGSEALARLPQLRRPVLILLDLQMPVMDGVTFLHHLRQRPRAEDFEVVVMSAGVSPEWLATAPGVVRALKKPFDLGEIVTLCAEFAERHWRRSGAARSATGEPTAFVDGSAAPPSAPEE